MTPSKLHSQLSTVDQLFHSKTIELDRVINNLQLIEVKEDAAFAATTARLKQHHLLEPIEFGEPTLGGHRTQHKKIGTAIGGDRIEDILSVTVNIPFTGSPEIFQYQPTPLRFSSSDTVVFQPTSNTIILEVDLLSLDKNRVLEKTAALLKTTKSVINQLNPTIKQWSESQERIIEERLVQKRAEIIKFYS